uniref:Orf174 protein n=1 Tax=Beta vulgaris subsp. vulgaris TaxID=3555 RepID=Q5U695_BETVV|nr:orf174 [Beta vulgaris subsp. vulgaris]
MKKIWLGMRVQLHCIARICVVIFENDKSPCFSHRTILFPTSPPSPRSTETKCRAGANSSSRKKGLTEPGSLTNTNLIENTNIIEKNCLFCILSPVLLLPRALRNRSEHIDIPSTQHRSSKGSRRPTKARKPGSVRKWIPIRRVHNRMDKLTLTRQFGMIQFGIFLGRYRKGIGM